MTKSILSIIFVSILVSSHVFGNEAKATIIDGVITRKHVALQYVSKEELDVLTSVTKAYQSEEGRFLRMSENEKAIFLATAEKVENGLAYVNTPEVTSWLSDVTVAKNIFRFIWSIDAEVKSIEGLLTPAESKRKEAFKRVFFGNDVKIEEISTQVPPAPATVEAFKKVFYSLPTQVEQVIEIPMM